VPRENIIVKNQIIAVADDVINTPEYALAKRLFFERKDLQARLRAVNTTLRQLQIFANIAVNFAKADYESEVEELAASTAAK